MTTPPIAEQLAEARRELETRRKSYPVQVRRGAMRQGEADRLLQRMEAICATLAWVAEKRRILRMAAQLMSIGALHKVEQGLLNHFHGHGLPVEMVDEEWVLRAPEERAINLTELATAVLDHFTSEGP